MNYYKSPIDFVRIFETNTRNLERSDEKQSIDHNLEMIISTSPGEHKFDPEYGCKIWDLDFEKVVSRSRWEDLFIRYITDAIKKYEPRVTEVEPRVFFSDIKSQNEASGAVSIRNKVDIRIDLKIISSGAKCCYYYTFYLGPLSSD